MRFRPSRPRWLLGMVLCVSALPTSTTRAQLTDRATPNPAVAGFVYVDIDHFIEAFDSLGVGVDSVRILQEHYLGRATPGLLMFMEKYDLTAERLRDAIRAHPDAYAQIRHRPSHLRSREPSYRAAYGRLKGLIPEARFPPTYFLVGAYRGIGSGSQEGPLVSIEKYTTDAIARGDMLPMLVHEMTHLQQVQAIGMKKYLAIYGAEKTLLALTIREGIAEFAAEWAIGKMTQEEARPYVLEHEAQLWADFQNDMMKPETGDWMWKQPDDPDKPPHVAYVLGARIVQSYYEKAQDKDQAIREIMAVTDYPTFLKKSGYGNDLVDE